MDTTGFCFADAAAMDGYRSPRFNGGPVAAVCIAVHSLPSVQCLQLRPDASVRAQVSFSSLQVRAGSLPFTPSSDCTHQVVRQRRQEGRSLACCTPDHIQIIAAGYSADGLHTINSHVD